MASIKPMVLKVGGFAPLGMVLRSKGANKTQWAIGGKNKGVENAPTTITN